MTKIDVFSGFLGAGKTTLIKKLLKEAFAGEKVVLIENEFGEIGIDGGFLKEAGVEITEMNSGCICCSLVGDFEKALEQVLSRFSPDRILIEPSGVGKLSDVVNAVRGVLSETVTLGSLVTVADASKCKIYMKNFGEFYNNQIEYAQTVILSRTDGMNESKLKQAVELVREHNSEAVIITTPWEQLDGKQILCAMESQHTLQQELENLASQLHHEHHHTDDCHCHEHEHHHADEVFSTFGKETAKLFTKQSLEQMLTSLDSSQYGIVLRAKGIVASEGGKWLHFDYVPQEIQIREGGADIIGRLCVIGSKLNEDALSELFGV